MRNRRRCSTDRQAFANATIKLTVVPAFTPALCDGEIESLD
jgi:hypothetical protein